jgi:predicted PurR-regulated permease PerM
VSDDESAPPPAAEQPEQPEQPEDEKPVVPEVDAPDGGATERPALPGPVVTLLGLAAGIIVLAGMQLSQSILGPVLLAATIGIAVSPLQHFLERRMPTWAATTITILVTYIGLTLFVAALAISLLQFAGQIPQYQDDFQTLLDRGEKTLLDLGVQRDQIDSFVGQLDMQQVFGVLLGLLRSLSAVLSDMAFVLALLFFVLVDASGMSKRLAAVGRIRPVVTERIKDLTVGVRRYLLVTTVFGAIVAAIDVGYLLALGVPLAFLWGLLAFVTGYIPNVGLILGLVPPAVIGLLDGGRFDNGLLTALLVIGGYLVINNVLQSGIQPKIIGDALGMSVFVSFLSLVVWSFVLGPIGALLAIPLSLLARAVLMDGDPRHAWLAILASDRPPSEDELERLRAGVAARGGRIESRGGAPS